MKRIVMALWCITTLLAISCQIDAIEGRDITIHILISPPQAQVGSISTNWITELQLIRKTTIEEPNGSTTVIKEEIISRKGMTANNEGKITCFVSLQKREESKKHEQIRYYYRVVCNGAGAYSDSSTKDLDASIPDVYDITILMNRN